jgi:hypothetical protein
MSLITPVPNGPFYSPQSNLISTPLGNVVAGNGVSIDQYGALNVASALAGTVTGVTAGPGLSTNGTTTGGTITVAGALYLLPPQGANLGGVKAGANVFIAADGTISVAAPGTGTVSTITVGPGLTGGGVGPNVTINLSTASTAQFGGVIVNSTGGISVTGGSISLTPASTTQIGGVTLATSVETIAGSNNTKAVTPAGLSAKVASTTVSGIVQLSDSVVTIDSTKAATPTAVKAVNDAAVVAQITASAALPKAGGTMTGIIVFAPGQTFPGVALPKATTSSLGVVQVGAGLAVNGSGVLSTLNNGTVTGVQAGPGLGAPATGNTISTSGILRLVPPTGTSLGGVKAGANISIAFDGTISVATNTFLQTNNPFSYNGYQWPIPFTTPSWPFPGSNGQVLTVLNNVTGDIGWTSTGTLTSVVAGTGLVASTISGVSTVGLATVGSIAPGSFGGTALIPTFSVNAQGQITSTGLANPYPPFQTATVTAPPNLVLDFDSNDTNWEYVLTGNLTIANPLNAQPGMRGGMMLVQNPSTPFALTWGSSWVFANNAPPAISTVAAAVDYFDFVVVRSNYIIVTNYIKGIG